MTISRRLAPAMLAGALAAWSLAAVVADGGTAAASPIPQGLDCSGGTCVFTTSIGGGEVPWQVPTGTSSVSLTLYGASGATPVGGGTGGLGAEVQAKLAVTGGSTLNLVVGQAGHSDGLGGQEGGGSSSPTPLGALGGGGGGATAVLSGTTPLLVAGGGGGGGGTGAASLANIGGASGSGGNGGNADHVGQSGTADPDSVDGATLGGGGGGGIGPGGTPGAAGTVTGTSTCIESPQSGSPGIGGTSTSGGVPGRGGGSQGGGGGGGGYVGGGGGGGGAFDIVCPGTGGGGGGEGGNSYILGAGLSNITLNDAPTAPASLEGNGQVVISYPDPVTVGAPSYVTAPGNALSVSTADGLLSAAAGATQTDGQLQVSQYSPTSAQGGTLSVGLAGNFRYTPPAGFSGKDSFSYTLEDRSGDTATGTATIMVGDAPAITSASSATFASGSDETFTVTASGPPAPTITESGAMPKGVVFTSGSNGTATFSGTPTQTGTFPINLSASDGIGTAATQSFTLSVVPALAIATTTVPVANEGRPYRAALAATGGAGARDWSLQPGAKAPAGLTLSAAGVLSGTPQGFGTFQVPVQVSDTVGAPTGTQTAKETLTVTVAAPLAIATRTLPAATVGRAYRAALAATGGAGARHWSLQPGAKAPAGLTLSAAGVLSGTPRAFGTFNLPVQVTDTTGAPTATKTLTLHVAQAAWTGRAATGLPTARAKGTQGYYIGAKANTWRVEVTQPHTKATKYTGTITINAGTFTGVKVLGPGVKLTHRGKRITFTITNRGKVDGFSFTTPDAATAITFTLHIAGKKATKSHVELGKAPHGHPTAVPFTIRRA